MTRDNNDNNNNKFDTLVCSGGGIKGIAILGVIKYMETNNILKNINTYVGTSISSIILFCINIGYTSDELFELVTNIELSDYFNISIVNFTSTYGMDDCSRILKLIKVVIKQQNISINLTFKELYEQSKKKLIINASCISTKTPEYFSYINNPNMKIIDAIMASICIPIMFNPVIINNQYYIDGALLDPFPINAIDKQKIKNNNVIGIYISCNDTNIINSLETYVSAIYMSLWKTYEDTFINKHINNIIYINIDDIALTDFKISMEDKHLLFNKGLNLSNDFFFKKNLKKKIFNIWKAKCNKK
jgi:NTE family protein